MEKRDANNWRIVDDILPQWVSNNENKLHESIEEALH
jgi:bifunctional pyridoxal-dependent enzyme with beta-cystathionase and maltose regulon repressor activities